MLSSKACYLTLLTSLYENENPIWGILDAVTLIANSDCSDGTVTWEDGYDQIATPHGTCSSALPNASPYLLRPMAFLHDQNGFHFAE